MPRIEHTVCAGWRRGGDVDDRALHMVLAQNLAERDEVRLDTTVWWRVRPEEHDTHGVCGHVTYYPRGGAVSAPGTSTRRSVWIGLCRLRDRRGPRRTRSPGDRRRSRRLQGPLCGRR